MARLTKVVPYWVESPTNFFFADSLAMPRLKPINFDIEIDKAKKDIINGVDNLFLVKKQTKTKGVGVFTLRQIRSGQYVTYYAGERLDSEPGEDYDDTYIFQLMIKGKKSFIEGNHDE